jgi:hypothetical protein
MTKRKKFSRTIIPLFKLSNQKYKTKSKSKKKCSNFEIHEQLHRKIHKKISKKKYKLSKKQLYKIIRNIEKIKISYINNKNAKEIQ